LHEFRCAEICQARANSLNGEHIMKTFRFARGSAFAGLLLATLALPACGEEAPKVLPSPALDAPLAATDGTDTAVLSGGCFWGMQGVYQHVKGVTQVISGYAGGRSASYEMVSTGTTGNAETVKITFDPKQISYGQILRIYFSVAHDPTELNYQGPDQGTQYRSDIWYQSSEQKHIADAYIAQLTAAHAFSAPIVTRVDSYRGFTKAEDYHQDYLIHNPDQPYIVYNDLPKIAALKRLYADLYRDTPVMVHPAT
jgi:peptide-methionine (S)-S-oxide reductase